LFARYDISKKATVVFKKTLDVFGKTLDVFKKTSDVFGRFFGMKSGAACNHWSEWV